MKEVDLKYKPKVAVLLIDMQNVFVDHLRMGAKEKIIPAQIKILKACGDKNIPVYVIELSSPNFPKEIMDLNTDIAEELKNINTKIAIVKTKDNAFTNTNLEELLLDQGVTDLILMGVNAQGCVLDTAKTAIEKGFKIITAGDLIGGQPTDREDDCAPWYQENGLFYNEGIDKLIELLGD